MADDDLLLVLGGATLYARRDAPTLEDGGWLGTEAVTFWCEVLSESGAGSAAAAAAAAASAAPPAPPP